METTQDKNANKFALANEPALAKTYMLAALAVLFIAFAGLYASGVFDAGGAHQVTGREYAEGEYTYSGGLLDGLFSERGVISYSDGSSYNGSFHEGRFHGEGVFNYVSGENPDDNWTFRGVFRSGQPVSGTFTFTDGTVSTLDDTLIGSTWQYLGGYDRSGQSGSGTFTYTDGSTYVGEFANGYADGAGTYSGPAGNVIYSGGFKSGAFHGDGTYHSPDGWVYEGQFEDGVMSGSGAVTQGSQIIRGVWENGRQVLRYE